MLTYEEKKEIGFVEATFSGEVFSKRHARKLDQALLYIESIHDPVLRALLKLLVWRKVSQMVAFGTSIGTSNRPFAEVLDGKRDWNTLNPKRLNDGSFEKLLKPVWHDAEIHRKRINNGVFAGCGPVFGYQMDAFDFVKQVEGDILYLDPPYPGTLQYESANKVLDQVLFGPEALQASPTRSPFSKDLNALAELLLVSKHIPTWVVSLNNKIVSLEAFQDLVRKCDPKRDVSGMAIPYKHLAHVSKQIDNQELLVISHIRKV